MVGTSHQFEQIRPCINKFLIYIQNKPLSSLSYFHTNLRKFAKMIQQLKCSNNVINVLSTVKKI